MGFIFYVTTLFMQNEYRPFYEIEFDFKTSLSKEDSVLAMLGWIRKPYREITEAEYDHQHHVDCEHEVSEEAELMFERHSPSLFEVLREIKDSADTEYVTSKIEDPLDEEALDEKLANIKKAHELIETAHKFYCGIDDELAKGVSSELRLDKFATINPENIFITLTSLTKWALKEYNITLFMLTKPLTFEDLGQSQQEIIEALSIDSGDTTHLQVTFALLVEAFSQTANTFNKSLGSPNASAIAAEIHSQIKSRDNFKKLSPRVIEGCIGSALAKIGYKTRSESVTAKTLNLCFALLVEAYAGKIDRYRDESSNPNVHEIAEHLARQPTDLAEQNQAQIKSRILVALEFRKNPYPRKPQ